MEQGVPRIATIQLALSFLFVSLEIVIEKRKGKHSTIRVGIKHVELIPWM
jgi:hypothetical protein